MRREIRRSAAVSAVLLVLLFALPLAVVTPFRQELFPAESGTQEPAERVPFQPGDLDGGHDAAGPGRRGGAGDDPGGVSGGGGPGGDARLL